MPKTLLNLRGVTSLVVDGDAYTRGLIASMMRGFGMEVPAVADNGEAALAHMHHHYVDLCVIEAVLSDMSGADLVSRIRRSGKGQIRFIPILVLTGYTQLRTIATSRDAGANIVLRKPVSPRALYDRIAWMAKKPRLFLETSEYVGPDRRFRDVPPPGGEYRRETDLEKTTNLDAAGVFNGPDRRKREGAPPDGVHRRETDFQKMANDSDPSAVLANSDPTKSEGAVSS